MLLSASSALSLMLVADKKLCVTLFSMWVAVETPCMTLLPMWVFVKNLLMPLEPVVCVCLSMHSVVSSFLYKLLMWVLENPCVIGTSMDLKLGNLKRDLVRGLHTWREERKSRRRRPEAEPVHQMKPC